MEAAREAHQKSTGHAFCKLCNRHFDNDTQLKRHEKDSHAVQFHCCLCDKDFVNNTALVQHLADKIHPISEASYRCEACDRTFRNQRSLEQHQLSPAHRPLANLTCLTRSCPVRFNCPSALIHHLESGRCSSGWSRQSINSVLHQYDINRVITSETVSLETSTAHPLEDSSSTSSGSPILTPSDSSMLDGDEWMAVAHPNDQAGKLQVAQAELQTSLHCFLCAEKGITRGFKSLKALQDHMSSPAHESRSFKCPLAFTVDGWEESAVHSRTFTTLSGLTQHLESARCRGGKPTLWKLLDYLKTDILRVEWPGRLVRD
ncbi:hypothetical protein P170DRAFT_457029 [Aspergillus steynii IBT 23096]|uniref:C2H2-type domain-containing protein n=1 Tax=Aspergillus steynii IBT 23096 TaxID=1392250 RepID=A0A2I2G0B0_9EURO|nr:uncharacterized protein P170DRAFT_457029 [Aspergillus steynii IBT 23096]PLB46325.1 hypothetical protein P170DRAFT_457029 [Aspergillus steynii IBT 23096]